MFSSSTLPVEADDDGPPARLRLESWVPTPALSAVLRCSEENEWASDVPCDKKSNPCPSMSLSLIKRSSSPQHPLLVPPLSTARSWQQLLKPVGESLLVLGLGDERLWLWCASWTAPTWTRSCTDMDLPIPWSIWMGLEQQPGAGGISGSSSRLICLLQEPSSFALSLPVPLVFPCNCCPNVLNPNSSPRTFPTLLSSVWLCRPLQKLLISGEVSLEVGWISLPGLTVCLEGGGGSLAKRGKPSSPTPRPPELLVLFGVRTVGELPTASSVPLSGDVAWPCLWCCRWGW